MPQGIKPDAGNKIFGGDVCRIMKKDNDVKNFARLVLFTFVCFILVFAASALFSFLQLWIKAASSVPVRHSIYMNEFILQSRWAVSFVLYFTILLSMNYARQNRTNPVVSFLTVAFLAAGLTTAAVKGLSNARLMDAPPFVVSTPTLGGAGLMLDGVGGTVITLIDKPALETGSRVVSLPGRPLIYQDIPLDENSRIIELPGIRFKEEHSDLYKSLGADFSLSAGEICARFDKNLFSFLCWICPLIILLISVSHIFDVGAWPLANLFICAVVFRGVLMLEIFLNSRDIYVFLIDFIRGLIPADLITPALFAVLAVLFLLYDILMYFAREKGRHDEI